MSSQQEFLPLAAADFQVLLVLMDTDLHAYGIAKAVEEQPAGRVRLEIGSLYRMLARMLDRGLIEERPAASLEHSGPQSRRRYYGLTDLGRAVAKAEAERLREVLGVAQSKQLLEAAE